MDVTELQLAEDGSAIYLQLANRIAEMVAQGTLKPGQMLPPQRDIAKSLKINLTTVTRAFASLQQRGLVESRAGRGSTVLLPGSAVEFASSPAAENGLIDLTVNRPATTGYLEALAPLMARLPKDPRFSALQDFHEPEGAPWAREGIVKWLKPALGDALSAERVVVTNGAQSGLVATLSAVARRGDVILADAVTYQGMTNLCRTLDVTLAPVEIDRGGIRVDALDAACAQLHPRLIFLTPCLHNPTTATLSTDRREAIAAIARRHECLIIEDDVYRHLLEDAPSALAAMAPERTIYVTSFSKTVAPGLRYGAVVAPMDFVGDIAAMQRVACWSISPLSSLVGTSLIESGQYDALAAQQRAELRQRQAMLREHLGPFDVQSAPESPHAWIHLPEPWRSLTFVEAARQRGVAVLAGEVFAIGRHPAPHAVRLNVGAARSRAALDTALRVIADLLSLSPRRVPAS